MDDLELSETASCTTNDEAQRSSQRNSAMPHFRANAQKYKNTRAPKTENVSDFRSRIHLYIHSQPKKVEAKDAAAYQEAPAQTFLRQGNVYPLIVAETITRARSSYPINATVTNPAREVTDFNACSEKT